MSPAPMAVFQTVLADLSERLLLVFRGDG